MGETEVDESVTIDAPAEVVWAVVSDPANYPRFSPEASAVRRTKGSGPWQVGDVFVGTNKLWVRWVTRCTIVRREEGTEFAFDVDFGPLPVARWSYEVQPAADGTTLLTERWIDRRLGIRGALVKPAGMLVGRGTNAAEHNRAGMRTTLERIRADLVG